MSAQSSASPEFALEVKNLMKSYGAYPGVWDVSLTVEQGTLHGFLGPNGSGKTTTMKCVMGLLHKTSGLIKVFGEEPHGDARELKKRVGYMPESPSFPAYLKGREVLITYGRIRAASDGARLREESRSLLQQVGLADAAEKPFGKYSRGMQTRLGIAVAMLGKPDLLILDEPTEGLDPVGVADVRNLLEGLVSEGRSVLLSSHQLSEVKQMCGKVTVVNKGRTVIEGSVEDLAKRLHGGIVYRAEFDSLAPDLMDELKTVDGVSEVTSVEEDVVAVLISKDYDVRPLLARLAVKHGSLLLSCEREETPLEELFISLVKENK
ncbi:MAG: ABC transporter ATP-binding protein [Nitrososphaerota archaeon]|nr:ABC transporter ATP-binding protein [Nitrososphaerota archaeon]MDG6991174.1 ABC transporter ATP-binding protein [Nitrososphaerota archaeon]